jgi:hypothetical protein
VQGDPLQYSVYREEAIEAMITALEHRSQSRKVQEQCARALLILAGRFSSSGEPIAEAWLLKRAGLDDSLSESIARTEIFEDKSARAVYSSFHTMLLLCRFPALLFTNYLLFVC